MFECSICCVEQPLLKRNKPQQISCFACKQQVCITCQKQVQHANCMYCKTRFTKQQIIEFVGMTFFRYTILPQEIKRLVDEQKALIPLSADWVDYFKVVEYNRTHKRFGMFQPLPPEPSLSSHRLHRCGKTGCSGILAGSGSGSSDSGPPIGSCNVCKSHFCMACHESYLEGHQCDPDTIKSLTELAQNSKPCPRCYVAIIKSEGCDHMHCTSCNTHFDWNTGQILANSSNHHYQHLQHNLYQHGTRHLGTTHGTAEATITLCEISEDEHIPKDIMEAKLKDHCPPTLAALLIVLLYKQPLLISKFASTEYPTGKVHRQYSVAVAELRVRFMNGHLTEADWGTALLRVQRNYDMTMTIQSVMGLYVNNIRALQSQLHSLTGPIDEPVARQYVDMISNMIDQCNQCFIQMGEDFIGSKVNVLCIRAPHMDFTVVPAVYNRQYAHQYEFGEEDAASSATAATASVATASVATASVAMITSTPVELRTYQIDHYNRITDILRRHTYAVDLSPMGTGKTYIGAKLIQDRKSAYNVVLCPASLVGKWNLVLSQHGLHATVLSYNELVSVHMQQPKHGLLFRDDSQTTVKGQGVRSGQSVRATSFRVTPRFRAMVSAVGGTTLLLDEFQHIKNHDSTACKACTALITWLSENATVMNDREAAKPNALVKENRVVFFSGTPIDKEQQCVTFYKTIGVNTCDELMSYNPHNGISTPTGLAQIRVYVARCHRQLIRLGITNRQLDQLDHVIEELNRCRRASGAAKICCAALIHIVLPLTSSQMSMKDEATARLICKNTHYTLSGADQALCMLALNKMTRVVEDRTQGITDNTQQTDLLTALHMLEESKVSAMSTHIIECLMDNETSKVVIVCNSLGTIEKMETLLSSLDLGVRVLTGSVSASIRDRYIRRFQQPDTQVRILIGTLGVLCSGIDLDDKDGRFPRSVFVFPCYSAINMLQVSNRFLRSTDTKSNTVVRFAYSSNALTVSNTKTTEQKLLASVAAKNSLIRAVAQNEPMDQYEREDYYV